jgi:hypothetical protein
VDATGAELRVLREGAIPADALFEAVPNLARPRQTLNTKRQTPGTKRQTPNTKRECG